MDKKQRGGARPGSGRPMTGRKYPLMVRISKEAHDKLEAIPNKSEFIDALIREYQPVAF